MDVRTDEVVASWSGHRDAVTALTTAVAYFAIPNIHHILKGSMCVIDLCETLLLLPINRGACGMYGRTRWWRAEVGTA